MELLIALSCSVKAQQCLLRASGSRQGRGGTLGLLEIPKRRWWLRLSITS